LFKRIYDWLFTNKPTQVKVVVNVHIDSATGQVRVGTQEHHTKERKVIKRHIEDKESSQDIKEIIMSEGIDTAEFKGSEKAFESKDSSGINKQLNNLRKMKGKQ